ASSVAPALALARRGRRRAVGAQLLPRAPRLRGLADAGAAAAAARAPPFRLARLPARLRLLGDRALLDRADADALRRHLAAAGSAADQHPGRLPRPLPCRVRLARRGAPAGLPRRRSLLAGARRAAGAVGGARVAAHLLPRRLS